MGLLGAKMEGKKEPKTIYFAKVTLTDTENYNRDWVQEGPAHKVLLEAIKYVGQKESKTVFNKIIDYLVEDFHAFDDVMSDLLVKEKKK